MSHPECDRCGLCCRDLIVEIGHVDVVREPKLRTAIIEAHAAGPDDWEAEYILCACKPCPMLGADNLCTIYPTRPNVCVAFEAGSEQCRELRERRGLPPLKEAS